MTPDRPLTIAYSDIYLEWMLGDGSGDHPTNPVRARLATEQLQARFGASGPGGRDGAVRVLDPLGVPVERAREAIESIHDAAYVARVLDDGVSGEWYGDRPEMGLTALAMFAGTMTLVEAMVAGDARVAFNPQGAKHHAARDRSSGFCVFNDMAWAALELEQKGLRPLYLDWDIHAGDGVQHLLAGTAIPTLSIHGHSTFPSDPATIDHARAAAGERHAHHDPARAIYITNVMPWRPPQTRDPHPAEIAMMRPFVERHIALAAPEIIVVMGNTPCAALLGTKGITKLRGVWTSACGKSVLPMFHPAYLLRQPACKREAWADLLTLQARLRG